jgi:xanthine dehydrogenase accessory factor
MWCKLGHTLSARYIAMQAADHEVLSQARIWLEAGETCWLATVVKTWGSSPRPVGSLFTCNARGQVAGSLSGGCVEDDMLEKLTSGVLARHAPQYFRYGLTAEETERFGLPCGGHLDVVVEPLSQATHLEQLRRIDDRLMHRGRVRRTVDVKRGTSSIEEVEAHEDPVFDEVASLLRQTYGPRFQLFIIGAGMVSKYLAEMAQMLDYAVTVCDPREKLLADFGVAGARGVTDMPDDAVKAYANDAASAIVALTHDPRIDDMGLMEALKTPAFYVGAMGSVKTSAGRRKRLQLLDVTDAELARLRAPIGLPIGSKTPPEIAIAILAEITAVRKQREKQALAHLAAVASPTVAQQPGLTSSAA